MAEQNAEDMYEKLMDEARDLITYSPVLDEDKKKPKCPKIMEKNKKGFEKLKKAVTLPSAQWMAHYNIAEFYYNGLDGATEVNEQKAVYHFFEAWTRYGNDTIMSETSNSPFSEPILINFVGLISSIKMKKKDDANNDFAIDIEKVICFCKDLEKKSQFISYRILSHAIHGRILWCLQKKSSEAIIHYKKSIQMTKECKVRISGHIRQIVKALEESMNEFIDALPRKCEYCNKEKDKLLRCGKCKKVYYCSIDCQRPHWKKHKKFCKKK